MGVMDLTLKMKNELDQRVGERLRSRRLSHDIQFERKRLIIM
jgi:hypothetical protein